MDVFASALTLLLDWQVILGLLIGSIGDVIIGAIPGVGAAVAIAILLPATFALPPLARLVMLLGIYGSSMYGGAQPAVLINTPGTAVNALTSYDGNPMTQNREARRAVALAYSASFFGGIFSIVCLILLSPLLAKIAPHFGSREIFLAALLGIILVALTAMMLSVFYVHNVIPGPQPFQNGVDFVMALYLALLVLNVIVLVFLMFSTNMLTRIIELPTRLIGVAILLLGFVGVYSLRNSITDCARQINSAASRPHG